MTESVSFIPHELTANYPPSQNRLPPLIARSPSARVGWQRCARMKSLAGGVPSKTYGVRKKVTLSDLSGRRM